VGALEALASDGLFTEDCGGHFGPAPLSEVLTASAPNSVKMVAQVKTIADLGVM
jgi:hypothetical protein